MRILILVSALVLLAALVLAGAALAGPVPVAAGAAAAKALQASAATEPAEPVFRVRHVTHGPMMPLGPNSSGREVRDIRTTDGLEAQVRSVEVVHTDVLEILTPTGKEKALNLFVSIHVEPWAAAAISKLDVGDADDEGGVSELMIGADTAPFAFVAEADGKGAELRAVLNQKELLTLLGAVHRSWKTEAGESPSMRWTGGREMEE